MRMTANFDTDHVRRGDKLQVENTEPRLWFKLAAPYLRRLRLWLLRSRLCRKTCKSHYEVVRIEDGHTMTVRPD